MDKSANHIFWIVRSDGCGFELSTLSKYLLNNKQKCVWKLLMKTAVRFRTVRERL